MNRSHSTSRRLRVARCTALLSVLLLAGCHHPASPADVDHDSSANPSRAAAHLILTVDDESGLFDLDAALAPGSKGGPALALIPDASKFEVTSVTCEGCGDGILDNQIITVDFVTKGYVDWVEDIYWDELTCQNCVVRGVRLRNNVGLAPGESFQVILRIDALRREQFTVNFVLLCAC